MNFADIVQPEEMHDAQQWLDAALTALRDAVNNGACFSFVYGGQPSAQLLPGWALAEDAPVDQDDAVLYRLTRTDAETGLQVCLELKADAAFPVLEWLVRFKNTGSRATPILEDIRSLDMTVAPGRFPYLHYWNGDYCEQDGYEPFRVSLAHGEEYRFAPLGGRPTNRAWPVLQPGLSRCAPRHDRRRGLVRAVGFTLRRPGGWGGADNCRAGVNAFLPAAGRGGAHPAFGTDVLARRAGAQPEPVAALDAGAQPAASRRQAA